jgi:hypothetical protein
VPALDEKPELFPELIWLWKAFMRLNRSRRFGINGPDPLQVSDITALADLMELTDQPALRFLDRMQLMDGAYLNTYYANKAKKNGRTKSHS